MILRQPLEEAEKARLANGQQYDIFKVTKKGQF